MPHEQDAAVPAPVRKVEARMAELDPNSQRYRVMAALRQFRASWVELGRQLNEVVYGGDYKEWGYDDFEVYGARELGLKKPTVQKLMVSYNYMKKFEGKLLQHHEDGTETPAETVPDYQTVALLDRVRRKDELPAEQIDELHRRAFDGEGEEPDFRRELRGMLTPTPKVAHEATAARRVELAQIAKTARELRRRISTSTTVPGGLRERLEQALVELEALEE
jgi:hypothetical protein